MIRVYVRSDLAIRRHKKGLCETPRCRNKHAKNKWSCHACYTRAFRFRNPLKYVYNTLKDNAKRRGKDFSLTFEEFSSFVKDTNYMDGRGRTKFDLSIDRRDNEHGYHAWNIRAITVSENSSKRNRIDFVKQKIEKNKLEYVKPEGEAF